LDWFVGFLESELDFKVSLNENKKKGKTKALATSMWLRKAIEPGMAERGIDVVASARNLGVTQRGAGKLSSRAPNARKKRDEAVKARKSKIAFAKRHGGKVAIVARRGLVPSKQYGARVVGTPPTELESMRKLVASALPGRHFGRSRTLRLATFGADPAPAVAAMPIAFWAAAVWDKSANEERMSTAWRKQQCRLTRKPNWEKVVGPASACIMQCKGFGWTWPAWHTFVTRAGLHIDMREICPLDVKDMVVKDLEAHVWATWTKADETRKRLHPAPLVEPVQRWFKKHRFGVGPAVAAQAVAAGLWTQQKANMHGVAGAENADCQACLKRGVHVCGDAKHRLGHCPEYQAQRLKLVREWQHQVATSQDRLLWDRGLASDPSLRYPFVPQPEVVNWVETGAEDRLYTGDVATDGSRIGNWRDMGQTGWAAVMLADDTDGILLASWGPLPTSLPVHRRIARAELWAVLQVLVNSMPPLRIHVDCSLVLRGVLNGRKWCVHSSRPHADVWRQLWEKIEDIGLSELIGVTFHKVSAHVSKAKREAAPLEERRLLVANDIADGWAKQGAGSETNYFLGFVNQAMQEQAAKVTGALDQIAGLAEAVVDEHGGWYDVIPLVKGVGARPKAKAAPRQEAPHAYVHTAFGMRCAQCFRVDDGCSGGCKPHAAARLAHTQLGNFVLANGHRLWRTGDYIWCIRCARYTKRFLRDLARPCTVLVKQKWWRTNLLSGRAPRAKATDCRIGEPHRVTVDEWLGWTFRHADEAEVAVVVDAADALAQLALRGIEAEGELHMGLQML
jgi:hypothetical protein